MKTLWKANDWMMVQDIRDRMDYPPVAYTTVATVAGILCRKGLARRDPGEGAGRPGSSGWWYRAARPASEHIGQLVATLLDHSSDPTAALAHALATAKAFQVGDTAFPGRIMGAQP